MANSDSLVPFGVAIIVVLAAFILIPFLRGKSDLLTAWNMLLLGIMVFTGLGSITVKYVPLLGWKHLDWFQPTVKEVQWYIQVTAAFIATLLASYYLNTPGKNFAQRRLRKWPELSAPLVFFVLGFCFVVVVASVAGQRVTFVGPLTLNLAVAGIPACIVFTFTLWNRNRLNLAWLGLFLGTFVVTALYAMVVSGGRRLLLSMFLGPILCLYWSQVRYWRPTRVLMAAGVAMCMILAVSAVYSRVRWYNLTIKEQRTATGIVNQLKKVREEGNLFSIFTQNQLAYLTQENGHYGLLTKRYVDEGSMRPVPLNTLRFLVTYPIPRAIWQNKPEVVGLTMPRDYAGVGTNWGLGIAGHGAYEGGAVALMIYAVLLSFFMRCFDEPMRLQPMNPFLIFMHASALPHIVGIARGDFGIMTKEAGQAMLFAFILGFVCRMIFGTQRETIPAANARQYRLATGPRAG